MMKFRITMKDADGVFDSIDEIVRPAVNKIEGLSISERNEIRQSRHKEIEDQIARWFTYGEYLTVEIDTDEMTCTVVEKK